MGNICRNKLTNGRLVLEWVVHGKSLDPFILFALDQHRQGQPVVGHLLPPGTAVVLGLAEGIQPLGHLDLVAGLGPLEGDSHALAGPRGHAQDAVR